MRTTRRTTCLLLALAAAAPARAAPRRAPDVPYEPTPPAVVQAMLTLARVRGDDIVYDLGSGDGRIVIAAAKRFGARGVGIDIDPQRVREARANAEREGVAARVRFEEGDLFDADLRPATVVTLFLYPAVNLRLRDKLRRELRPGARVVSHWHDMGDWTPDRVEVVDGRRLYLWRMP